MPKAPTDINTNGQLVSFRLKPEVLERLDKFCRDNRLVRSAVIKRALESYLDGTDVRFTKREQRKIVNGAIRLDEVLDRKLIEIAEGRQDLLDNLDDKSLAQLIVSRIPKQDFGDRGFNEDALSLRNCLQSLPSDQHITRVLNEREKELSELRKRLSHLEKEMKIYREGVGDGKLGEFIEEVFGDGLRFAVEYIARNDLPGFANGVCCIEGSHRQRLEREVEKCLNRFYHRKR